MCPINKLSDRAIKNLTPSSTLKKYGDGDKLWLVVTPSGNKTWRIFWKDDGKQKQFTIGPYPAISLKAARQERDRINTLLAQGIDPNDQKKWDKNIQATQEAELALTFKKVAMEWYEKRTIRQSEQTRKLKLQRLEKHVFPSIGNIPFSQLKLKHLIGVLQAVEATGHGDMAIRIHSIISNVCRFARIMGYSEYDISSGAKDALLPKAPVKHRAAITKPEEVSALLQNLKHRRGEPSTIFALKIMPYVFTRSHELRGGTMGGIRLGKESMDYSGKPHEDENAAHRSSVTASHSAFTGTLRLYRRW
ncbi:MAG: tyrosine-type recombinase/integrase [Mailhella sp.]